MPSEKILSAYEDPNAGPMPWVSIGWGDAPEVQIGVVHAPPEVRATLKAHLVERNHEIDLSEKQLEAVLDVLTDFHAPALGWYTHLDRPGVNRAIRTLRRARNRAFGVDE